MVERWNPLAEVDRFWGDMDRVLSQSLPRTRMLSRMSSFTPLIDLYDTGEHLVVRALIPGIQPEDIDVTLEQNVLTIAGRYGDTLEADASKQYTWYRREIGSGQFAETVSLPVPVEADGIEATFEHGVLTLTLPKAAQARTKRIAVQGPNSLANGTS
jgi:HSP20 family protein